MCYKVLYYIITCGLFRRDDTSCETAVGKEDPSCRANSTYSCRFAWEEESVGGRPLSLAKEAFDKTRKPQYNKHSETVRR